MHTAGKTWKGYDVVPYTNNAIYHYDYLLVSAWYEQDWYNSKNSVSSYKDIVKIQNVTLYGDSGGFQAGRKGFDLDVEATVKWQTSACDYAVAFDQPPNSVMRGNRILPSSDSIYYDKMRQTYENNLKALSEIEKHGYNDIPYFNVMHGTTLERRDVWYSAMENLPIKYKAVAMRPAGDPVAQSFAVCHAHSRGYRDKLHVLGVGSTTVLPAMIYMSDMFDSISFDSSSYGNGAIRRMYYYDKLRKFYNLGHTIFDPISDKFKESVIHDGLKCACPVCSKISKEETPIFWESGSMGGSLMTMHNMYLNVEYVKEITNIFNSVSKKEYKEIIIENYIKESIKLNSLGVAFGFIDEYKKNGIEKAYYKYSRVINEDNQTVLNQELLF